MAPCLAKENLMKTRFWLFALTSILFSAGSAMAYPCQGWHYQGSNGESCPMGSYGVPLCGEPQVVWEPGVTCYPTAYGIMACECPDHVRAPHHHRHHYRR
jgi:hypothetical protein